MPSPSSHQKLVSYFSNLANALSRSLTLDDRQLVEHATLFALENGALTELDFERQPEVSFNPRPARIVLILLNDAGVRDSKTLAAAALATLEEPCLNAAQTLFNQALCKLALSANLPPQQLLKENFEPSVALIALALWLDRARHLHLSPSIKDASFRNDFVDQTRLYIQLANKTSSALELLLEAWLKRFFCFTESKFSAGKRSAG